MSVESADENFERKRNEMKTMVGLEIAKTLKTLGFPGQEPLSERLVINFQVEPRDPGVYFTDMAKAFAYGDQHDGLYLDSGTRATTMFEAV